MGWPSLNHTSKIAGFWLISLHHLTIGFLYGAGAETLIFVTGTTGKYPKLFRLQAENQNPLWIPRKPRKIGIWVSGAEIQTSAVDTRTAVWVSTPEKFSKIVLGKSRNVSWKFRSQATQPPLTSRQGSEYRGRVPDTNP